MKKLSLAAITTLVALLGYQATGEAAAPKVGRATSTVPVPVKPDLRCKVEAFFDAAATQPLQNNGTEINLGDVWVRASVRNASPVEAKAFSNTLSIVRNSSSVHESSPELTIPGGYTMMFPLVKVTVGHSGSMEATLKVDSDGEIGESNELNNLCTFKTKSNKLH